MVCRKLHDPRFAVVIEECVDMDQHRVGTLLDRTTKCVFQFSFAARTYSNHFDSDASARCFETFCIFGVGILRIDQYSDNRCLWVQQPQQLQTLGTELAVYECYSRYVPTGVT